MLKPIILLSGDELSIALDCGGKVQGEKHKKSYL